MGPRNESRIDSWSWKLALENQWQLGIREAKEHPSLKAVIKQRDWEHWYVSNSDL
jgi:hypothetical protein